MKLVIAMVQDNDAENLLQKLNDRGFMATKFATTGGFLRRGNTTILTGVDDDKVEAVKDTIKSCCEARQLETLASAQQSRGNPIDLCGATVFVLDVAEFHKF
ncbi:cyclic-di-AMP receptor [Metallumcola ferriviriculae]|uniref:Cyclic-di-AMP receptor n=1 Tax=Metallumcola ferriviriculae TaxID=3039180 RepID=A0AAU0UIE3_9FIRM|nr:cyclic-di-AMP receptor [Desulfitibacteraceae bacterium MK1]